MSVVCVRNKFRLFSAGLLVLALITGTAFSATVQLSGNNLALGLNWVDYSSDRLISLGNAIPAPKATLHTTFRVNHSAEEPDVDQIWLAALMSNNDQLTPEVALVWQVDRSGFIPVWNVLIASKALPLKSDQTVVPGDDVWKGYYLTKISGNQPEQGHTYNAYLSYDTISGFLSVSLHDTNTQQVISQTLQLPSRTSAMVPAISRLKPETNSATSPVEFTAFSAYPLYVPLTMDWNTEVKGPQDIKHSPAWGFSKQDDVRVQLSVPEAGLPGEYTLAFEHDGVKLLSVVLPSHQGKSYYTLPLPDLPLGESDLWLTYSENGQVLVADQRAIVVGSATIEFGQVTVDRAAQVVHSTVNVTMNCDTTDLNVNVVAQIYRLNWDPVKRNYTETLQKSYALKIPSTGSVKAGQRSSYPISFPLPDAEGLWKVVFQTELQPGVLTTVANEQKQFSTYVPDSAEPGKPFTIAVLPDTQGHTSHFPHILTRQAQWIAENADDRNIALMLHMGDITNGNTKVEWERVQSSFNTLNGVVPYVLAIGNHDLLTDGIRDRNDSLMERYLPESYFPTMAGTYEPGEFGNSYHLFELGGHKYMVLAVEYGPRDEVLDWANKVVAAYPDYKVIVITHFYLSANGMRASDPPKTERLVEISSFNDGEDIWSKLVFQHSNIQMVLSGHIAVRAIPRNVQRGANGNPVFELLFDYQSENNGGNGWLGLLEFSTDGKVEVRAYSPYLDSYKTEISVYGHNNHFIMDLEKGSIQQVY